MTEVLANLAAAKEETDTDTADASCILYQWSFEGLFSHFPIIS